VLINTLLALALSVAVVGILDILLSEGQKAVVAALILGFWVWLDDKTRLLSQIPDKIFAYCYDMMARGTCGLIRGVVLFVPQPSGISPKSFGKFLLIFAGLHSARRHSFDYYQFLDNLLPSPATWHFPENSSAIFWYFLMILGHLVFGAIGLFIFISAWALYVVAGIVLVLHIVYLVTKVLEFFVRRTVEYPKGPIVAVGLFSSAVLSIIKVLAD